MKTLLKKWMFYFIAVALLLPQSAHSQCQLNDGTGVASATPYWIAPCNGLDYTVFIQSPTTFGAWTINWGDGSPIDTGDSLIPPAFISHLYPATVDTFIVTFNETATGCTVQGVVVLERVVTAELGIPGGVSTQICAPDNISFVNNTNLTSGLAVSQTTVFTWDYGDGSPIQTFDYTNILQQVTHTYQKNTVNCNTTVVLTAKNYCGLSTATFNPIQVWDVDKAAIDASQTLLCYPDTEVLFQNNPMKNCLPDNSAQRYEYWNFGDYWGVGTDSIIPWNAYDPPSRLGYNIAYPGIGSYNVLLIDSNFCGQDTATLTVNIVAKPTASASALVDTVCVGSLATFINASGGGGNSFSWNFGDGSGWTTTGLSNQTHTYTTTGDFTVQLVANIAGAAGCTDTTSVNIHILPSPVAGLTLNNNNSCDTLTVTFTDASTGGAISWFWDFGNGNTSTLQNPPSQFYNTPGNYIVTLDIASANGCVNNTSQTVNLFQSPVANFTTSNVCVGANASFTDASTSAIGDPIISWFWNFDDGNNNTSQNANNTYVAANTYNVSLFVSTAFCNNSDTVPITVTPIPTSIFTLDIDSGCTPHSVNFTNSSTGAATYLWGFGDGNTSTVTNPSHIFINSGTTDTTFLVSLIAQTAFGCEDTMQLPVVVHPNITANFSHNATVGCAPMIVDFTNTSTGATNYNWAFGDGTGSNLQNPTHTFVNTTLFIQNFTIQLIANSGICADTTSQTISVFPSLNVSFTAAPDSGCAPLTVTFPPAVGAVGWNWDFGDGTTSTLQTPTHTFNNTSTNNQNFTVQLIAISPFGCTDTSTQNVLVLPKPNAAFTLNDSIGCHPLSVNFSNTSTGGSNFIWDFGNGNTTTTTSGLVSNTFTNTSSSNITYTTQLIAITADGCTDTAFKNSTVFPEVIANFFQSDTAGCSPLAVNFVEQSSGATLYNWNFGDGFLDSIANPSHTFINTTLINQLYNVQFIATSPDGCSDTAVKTITIYPKPTANFTFNPNQGCQPLSVNITDQSVLAKIYNWNLGDGTLQNDTIGFSHIFTNTTTNSIINTLILEIESVNGCKDTLRKTVEVYPQIIAVFIASDTIGCNPLTVNFTDLSTGVNSYNWDFGDGNNSTSTNPSPIFVNTTLITQQYNVELIVSSSFGCSDTAVKTITIYPKPTANFTFNPNQGCQPLSVNITDQSVLAKIYNWNLGDGTLQNDTIGFSHIFTNTTASIINNTITLMVQSINGCADTIAKVINIFPQVIADFNVDSTGCSPITPTFTNNSTNGFLYTWNFGDGNTSTSFTPLHQFSNNSTNDTTFIISLIVETTEGCRDTILDSILIHPSPMANFTATPISQQWPDSAVTINNLTNTGNWQYAWDFGDNVASVVNQPISHSYSTWGVYTIDLVVNSPFCFDSISKTITLIPPLPIASFEGTKNGCKPVEVTFTNTSIYGVSFSWDFGDGATSNNPNPTHSYFDEGLYSVNLTVTGPGGDLDFATSVNAVQVNENALAFFTYAPSEVVVPNQPVGFFNQSSFAATYFWDFGDGTTSLQENPEHTYITAGTFDVRLIANNSFNCPDTMLIENAVFAEEKGNIVYPNAFTPNLTGGNGGIYDKNSFNNDVFFPVHEGIIDYHLMIFNRWGELLFESFDVNIGWDGYFQGVLSPQDVYVWKVTAKFANGKIETKSGDLTLIR